MPQSPGYPEPHLPARAIGMSEIMLTIGGSDSGGGAGIQADIKTFSILGWHGTSALTAVTAQNTSGVQRVFPLGPEAVAEQLKSISDDFHVAFAKTGMLCSPTVVSAVAEHLRRSRIPLVLDPVMAAEAGGQLIEPGALVTLKEELIPLAGVIVPNIFEARRLTGRDVRDLESAELAAREISSYGARAVIVKGGHLDCTDLLLADGEVYLLKGQRVMGGNHGVGCTYSAALTCFLAGGCSLKEAARKAKGFAAQAISWSLEVGRGVHPVNQAGAVVDRAERFAAMVEVQALGRVGIQHWDGHCRRFNPTGCGCPGGRTWKQRWGAAGMREVWCRPPPGQFNSRRHER
jgi:hydroxymethylpyrimidine kinase/phosphomethylpyrimidine kinase